MVKVVFKHLGNTKNLYLFNS